MDIASLVFSTGITSAILQVVLDRLATYVTGLPQFIDRSEDLSKLEKMLHLVKPVVEDVEKKRSMPEACRNLLEDVKSVILDAEDLLNEIDMELQTRISSDSDMGRVLSSRKFMFNIPGGLSKIHDELVDLKQNLEKYNLRDLGPPQTVTPSTSLVNESTIVGRGTDKQRIIEMILSKPSMGGDNFSVIPIVGIGGIGKTALAQLVCNDPDVVNNFHFIIWVSVSINYDVMRITRSILDSVEEQASWYSKLKAAAFSVRGSLLDLNRIQIQLKNQLKGKKFLLVLDDMWNENSSYWDTLQSPFRFAAQGSKILMTTRSKVVSSILSGTPAYHLDSLSLTDCWAIIKQTAKRSDAPVDDVICLKIAKLCKGVPLVAKVIGDVMHKFTDAKWDSLLKFELWESPEHGNHVYPALKSSYDELASYLKRCFSYCSIFPRDHQFEKDELVQLWAAEGFIQARGGQEIEDIGREYFGGLCSRLFFTVSHSHEKRYKMHDLIHDLARLVAANLSVCIADNMPASVKPLPKRKHARYSSLLCQDIDSSTLKEFHQYEKLRTFMLLSKPHSSLNQVPYDFFLKLGWLRVLNLSYSLLSELPESIEFLIHLRYLDLSRTYIKRLPKSIANLYALEILKLMGCSQLLELPENLKKLIRLRHLDFDGHRQISSMPIEVGNLICLETLYGFVVGRDRGYQIGELKNMKCLRGSICITNLENVTSAVEGEAAMLQDKQYLDKLELEWSGGRAQTAEEDVLGSLKPHVGLKELCITGYCALVFPDWIADSLYSKLEKIELNECVFCTCLPSLGQLPALKHLTIKAMQALEIVDQLFSAGSQCNFPLLETLKFENMPKWKRWSQISETDMPRLKELSMLSCEELESLPFLHYLKSLKVLVISDCPMLESLPSEGLPLSMGYLSISGSDCLMERCRVGGADWNKIGWFSDIFIDPDLIILQERKNIELQGEF